MIETLVKSNTPAVNQAFVENWSRNATRTCHSVYSSNVWSVNHVEVTPLCLPMFKISYYAETKKYLPDCLKNELLLKISDVENPGMSNITFSDTFVNLFNKFLKNLHFWNAEMNKYLTNMSKMSFLTVYTTPIDFLVSSQNASFEQDLKLPKLHFFAAEWRYFNQKLDSRKFSVH